MLPIIAADAYTIQGEFARGGLGRILVAYDRRLERVVALKELLEGEPDAEARFVREALVTAQLEHPAIVPVHEAARWPDGGTFYAMKLVSGRSLLEVIGTTTSLEERLALLPNVIAVAEAIAYAHSKRVIHRDIKPANIIVGQFGETVVIDWGLAKDLAAQTPDPSAMPVTPDAGETQLGSVMGTPAYMPPEQARGETVDERADVYSLGAVLYHVLSGVTPYSSRSASEGGDTRVDQDSTGVLVELSIRPPIPLEDRQPGVPRDLSTIVAKAMARSAAERYPSAKEVAEDLKRFQTGQLVSAHHYSTWALVRRWLSRYRASVGVAAAGIASLLVIGTISITRIIAARNVAETKEAEAVKERGVAENERREARLAGAKAEARNQQLILLQASAALDHDPAASIAWLKQYPLGATDWHQAGVIAGDAQTRVVARQVFRVSDDPLNTLAMSPDGQWVAASGADGRIFLWSVAGPQRTVIGRDLPYNAMAFSPDGKLLAVGGSAHVVRIWNLSDKTSGRFPVSDVGKHDDVINSVAFAPDGQTIASGGMDKVLRLWDLRGGTRRDFAGHTDEIEGVAFSPNGKIIATGSDDGMVRLWDFTTGRVVQTFTSTEPWDPVFSPDGQFLAAVDPNGTMVWSLATGARRIIRTARGNAVAFSPDAQFLAVATDRAVELVEMSSGQVTTLHGHERKVTKIEFSGRGDVLASAGADGTVRIWSTPRTPGKGMSPMAHGGTRICFRPDSRVLVGVGGDASIRLWDVATGDGRDLASPSRATYVACSSDGKHVATVGMNGTLLSWDLDSGKSTVLSTSAAGADAAITKRIRYSPDGSSIGFLQKYEGLWLYDLEKMAIRCGFQGRDVIAFAFAPDSRQVAYGSGTAVHLGDTQTCASRALYTHTQWVLSLAFSADGRYLASAGQDGKVGLIELPGGDARLLEGHSSELFAVAFSPVGDLLASSGFDNTVRLWDPKSGATIRILRGHESGTTLLAFRPDGKALASASIDKTIRLWDTTTGESTIYRGHNERIYDLVMSPDGQWLASIGRDGYAHLWPTDPSAGVPSDPENLKKWFDVVTTARINGQNLVESP